MNSERAERSARVVDADRTHVPAQWQAYLGWLRSLPLEVKERGHHEGVWPEGTPQHLIDLHAKTLPEEVLLWTVFGDYPPIEEILRRTPDDMQRLEAEKGEPRLRRLALAAQAAVPPHTTLTAEQLEGLEPVFPMPDISTMLENILKPLIDRERLVLRQRFGLDDRRGKTQAEVAQTLGRSVRTVQRIEHGALQKLRGQRLSATGGTVASFIHLIDS